VQGWFEQLIERQGALSVENRTFIVKMKYRGLGVYLVVAERLEVHEDHLVLLHPNGRLAGLFFMQAGESWHELPAPVSRPA
jgi:hypothetical protein